MRIITFNANGIRAAARKGFFRWLSRQRADVVCVQETKAWAEQLDDPQFHPRGFHCYYLDARKKGYSGVALYSRAEPQQVVRGFGDPEIDAEARWLEVRYPGLAVVSMYAPSGTSGDERQSFKYRFLDLLMPRMQRMRRARREFVLCGDWNIAHRRIDIENWRGNQKNSGFLPAERAWLDQVYDRLGFVDAFRVSEPGPRHYTWWSNRGRAWEKNVGWRIDYQVVTPGLGARIAGASVYKRRRFSDHAPLTIDYQ